MTKEQIAEALDEGTFYKREHDRLVRELYLEINENKELRIEINKLNAENKELHYRLRGLEK